MGYHSGMWGVINGQSTVRNWSLNTTSSPFAYKASNTAGGTARVDGTKDWNGSFNQLGAIPLLMPGDSFAFAGYTAPDDDVLGSNGTCYSGTAIVDQVVCSWNWGASEALNIAVNFSANGVISSASSIYSDATAPQEYTICGTKIEYGDSGSETELENVAAATLTFSAANQGSVNSSSSCYMQRRPGPIDWTAAITLEDNTQPITLGTSERFLFYIDDTYYWELQWGLIRDYSNLTVNRETGAIIRQTMNVDMDGIKSGVQGTITLPGTSSGAGEEWWPFTA